MSYASVADMIAVFGEAEMIRLSAPEDRLDDGIQPEAIDRALIDAAAMIDGYLRGRHAVPLADPVPPEIARACRILARYDLGQGGQKTPSESMTRERAETIAWLRDIAAGRVELDVAAAPATATPGAARVTDRAPLLTAGGPLQW